MLVESSQDISTTRCSDESRIVAPELIGIAESVMGIQEDLILVTKINDDADFYESPFDMVRVGSDNLLTVEE